eukprot:CAMPEP_0176427146 /NCGR_PEP_ID=MMETSP0127-20121128/12367_1 /TAXON_ID=938130 /ORGANISM="Platyophrya macrostoma, Strain WH" /LENGTH=201 /DNA_ID=CAMNT_0017808555 /DNA_START=49 /DNA_END=654 /DNA_ORIENTATION=-
MHTKPVVLAAVGIAACPTIWNIVARNEYRNHSLERFFKGKRSGCYVLAAWIFFSSLYRDYLFEAAVKANASATLIPAQNKALVELAKKTAGAVFAGGMTLVLSAYYRLGITGTYLGDYFGILMSERVTSFPFSVFENPMYLGSTLSFLAISLLHNSAVGVALTAWVQAVYWISTTFFEGPFTASIYEKAAAEAAAAASSTA